MWRLGFPNVRIGLSNVRKYIVQTPALPKSTLPKSTLPKPELPKPALPKSTLPRPTLPRATLSKPALPKPRRHVLQQTEQASMGARDILKYIVKKYFTLLQTEERLYIKGIYMTAPFGALAYIEVMFEELSAGTSDPYSTFIFPALIIGGNTIVWPMGIFYIPFIILTGTLDLPTK